MACDLIQTELAGCLSEIKKIESQTRLLRLIAELSCEIADAGGGGGGSPGGAPGDLQFNDSGAFGGFGDYNSGTSALTLPGSVTAPTFIGALTGNVTGSSSLNVLKAGDTMTGLLTNLQTALGVTTANAFLLTNTTAAAAGAQQVSPAIRWTGQGWGTTAPGSQAVDFRMHTLPVQGTAAPSGRLIFGSSINGGAFTEMFSIGSNGWFYLGVPAGASPIIAPNGSTIMVLGQNSGSYACNVGSLLFTCISTGRFGWNSGGDGAGAQDTALGRNAAGIVEVNNGTAGAFRDLYARILRVSTAFTVATLPAAGTAGRIAYVTDSLAPAFLAIAVGGGAIVTTVLDNGTNWVTV